MGWVTPLGSDIDSAWSKLVAGERALRPIERFDAKTFATDFASEVPNFDLASFLGEERAARHEKSTINVKFALAAAEQAWRQAGLADGAVDPLRIGMYLGSGEGAPDFERFAKVCIDSYDEEAGALDTGEWGRQAKEQMIGWREIAQEPHSSLVHLAEEFGCRGPVANCMTACAATNQAIGEALELLRYGDADVMLAGGAHSMIHPLGMTGFIRLTAMSTRCDDPASASRPFDATRDGFVMGEGAGMLVLETLDHALARGATPIAEIVGYGSTADAYRITDMHPDGEGPSQAMIQALRMAGINPTEPGPDGRSPIHYICAHGTGTSENDRIETTAIKKAFGPMASKVPISSVKSMLGHLIQTAGVVEAIVCVQAIKTGIAPPTANLNTPDPQLDLDYIPNQARDLRDAGGIDVCLSNSFGFGGQNDTIIIKRYEP